jgi:hypothetical protein
LRKADAKVDIKEEASTENSIVIRYSSPSAGETCIRRFLQEKGGGIHMLTYHVRSQFKKEKTLKIWDAIIRDAILVPSSTSPDLA